MNIMKESDLMSFFGMTESKAKETAKNLQLSKCLSEVVDEFDTRSHSAKPEKKTAVLLYTLGSKLKPSTTKYLPLLVDYIFQNKLDSEARVTAALRYLVENLTDAEVNLAGFDEACGIGINVTDDEIERVVKEAIQDHLSDIVMRRYRFNIGVLLSYIRTRPRMMWADGGKVKCEADQQLIVLLGPKTDEDRKPAPKPTTMPETDKAKLQNYVFRELEDYASPHERIMSTMKKLPFHKPGNNYIADGYPTSEIALELLSAHARIIGDQVRTRFPPEPNGILHIGHAKAININFGYAKAHDGVCFLRYDDTNPEKEEERFFKSIREMVEWLGYTPYKVTHASDNFDKLYEFAKVLIRKGLAYVCHQRGHEIQGYTPEPSRWRGRRPELNLALFEGMKKGKFNEGAATLRMKITLEEGKVDPVAYRIRYISHPKTGNKWCIYPTYDFTHCLCDSLENITHSMCTKEFQNRRSSYYWLCEAVETYVPVQWEYGRLNMCYTVVSKRKIAKLIEEHVVKDWDDPRLFTLPALRRRGFPAEAINDFCTRVGITGATITVEPAMLDACVRDILNITAPRTMAVLEPVKILIENFPFEKEPNGIAVPDFPSKPDSSSHTVTITKEIYIDKDDFRVNADKGYKRFASDQPVGLRHANLVLTCKEVCMEGGEIKHIIATCKKVDETEKPKGFIHWVSDTVPVKAEVRLYSRLFNHKFPEDPEQVPDGFISDCNTNSLTCVEAIIDRHLIGSKPFTQFQFERIGFFSVDPDSTDEKMVFNRTVSLKEDSEKN